MKVKDLDVSESFGLREGLTDQLIELEEIECRLQEKAIGETRLCRFGGGMLL